MGVNVAGLDALANGIQGLASLELVALVGATFSTATIEDSTTVAFTAASGGTGVIEITANVSLTISSGKTINWVVLREVGGTLPGDALAAQELTSDNAFPAGGDLIVTSFEITVS